MFKGLSRLTGVVMLACLVISTAARAEVGKQIYSGTLGSSPIVLELNTDDPNEVSGRYFYQKYRRDLLLSGAKDGTELNLHESRDLNNHGTSLPSIHLRPTPHGWSGEWTSPVGKVLKIALEQAKLPPIPSDTLPYLATLLNTAPYDFLRLQGMKLKQGKTEVFMGYTLQWWSEPQSKMQLFEVVSGYPAEQRRRINQKLMGRLWQQVVNFHECLTGYGMTKYSQKADPLWMSPSVLSVNINAETNCGGNYSDENDMPFNLDATTGKALALEDVLRIGQGEPQALAPWLVAQLSALYPDEVTITTDRNDSCAYDEEQPWRSPSWYFTDKGIKLLPSFPHNETMCRSVEWSVLPYSLIKQHPGGVTLQLP
jgi:hypothetical protein